MRPLLITTLAIFVSGAARAQEPERVILDEAVRLGLEHNLTLRLARADAAHAAGLARQAGAYPNPSANVTRESLSDGTRETGETYLTLSQRLEWPWIRSARASAGARAATAAYARLAADSAETVFRVRSVYVDTWAAERRLAVAAQVAAVFRRADSSAAARFAEGDLSGYDRRRLALERVRWDRILAGARQAYAAATRALALEIRPEGEALGFVAASAPSVTATAFEQNAVLARAMATHPELAAAESDVAAANAAASHGRRARLPSPTLTGGYKTQDDGFDGIFLGASLPLPLFDRNGGAVAAEEAGVDRAQARVTLARRLVMNDARNAWDRWTAARRQYQALDQDTPESGRELLDIALASYAEGEMDLLALLDAARTLYEVAGAHVDVLADYWTAYFDLDRAAFGLGGMEDNR